MKLTVFGATGGTGSQVVSQGLAAGHEIIAVVRDPSRRLVIVSASGPYADAGDGPVLRYVAKPILGRTVFKTVWADHVAMEEAVRASGLDWTVLRPPRLTDKPLTGRYRTRDGLNLRGGLTVSRADVAHLALAVAGDPDTYRTAIYLAN
jgi:uncharacterized protein YbjT (DUF2867 family)